MRTIFRLASVSLVLFAVLTWCSSSQAQKKTSPKATDETADDVVRVNTALVTLPVSVMDRRGRFISDLKQEQFHLFEDGVEQQIAYFDSAEKPFTVALLLDVSDSTKAKLISIQDAAAAFIDQLRPADRVFIVTFDQRINVLCKPTSDRAVLNSAIRRTETGGGTSLYGALDLVVKEHLSHIPGRKAIVLLTDGVDTTSKFATFESTLNTIKELDSLIYPIQYNTSEDLLKVQSNTIEAGGRFGGGGVVTAKGETLAVAYERATRYLKLLADNTGGRFFYADSLNHLRERFAGVAAELREQYSLGYYPTNRSAERAKRELKVRVTVPDVAVRARRSYIYTFPSQ
ncbi:MAG: VWA domain-containing protein [Acidobacteriota bacterium]|nr:VWA domain-containing protein [Acidobacteriota bacterium]